MKHIASFFENKKNFSVFVKKEKCIEIIFKLTNITLTNDQISFSGKTIFLKTSPKEKYLIQKQKESIYIELKKEKTLSFYETLV